MKVLLIVALAVFCVAKVCATTSEINSFELLNNKSQKVRTYLTDKLLELKQNGFESNCKRILSPKEIVFGNEKFDDSIQCFNTTIDKFIYKLVDNEKSEKNYINTTPGIKEFAGPACSLFDDIFKCILGDLNPILNMCLDDSEIILKNKLFAILPLIHQSICLRNGAVLIEIVEHEDGRRCIMSAFLTLVFSGFQFFASESTELFGDEATCQQFNEVLKLFYGELNECSPDVLDKMKDILGYFCDGTQCDRYVHDIQCY